MLIFSGGHQSREATALNDALHPGEDPFTHEVHAYESSYTVWANYDVAGAPLDRTIETSASQLAAQVLHLIGVPPTDYQKAQLVLSQQVPSMASSDIGEPTGYDMPSMRKARIRMHGISYR